MHPYRSKLFHKCKLLYNKLLNPLTGTADCKYFAIFLENQLKYCRENNSPLSLVILFIASLPPLNEKGRSPEFCAQTRKITAKIKNNLTRKDIVFYDGDQTFTILFPRTDKQRVKTQAESIQNAMEQIYIKNIPLTVKGGYAEFPTDAQKPDKLNKFAQHALKMARQSPSNNIVGYFTEKRKSFRFPLKTEVRYKIPESHQRLTCSRNISENGIMISGMPDLPMGKNIRLTFKLPSSLQKQITITARSVWGKICARTGKMDIGLSFSSANNPAQEQIRSFIHNISPRIIKLF